MNDFRLSWRPEAMPLGPAIKRESFDTSDKAANAYAVMHFAAEDYNFGIDRHGVVHTIDEAQCKQIKGAADRKVRQEAHAPREADLLRPAAPPSTSGVWVKTSERKPPDGARCVSRGSSAGYGEATRLFLDGAWRAFCVDALKLSGDDLEWLDTSPRKQADADGWIEHDGGECPVAKSTRVEVRLRNGKTFEGCALSSPVMGDSQWLAEKRLDSPLRPLDIVAYRVLP